MASCKVIRRLALLQHARGLCLKQDVLQSDHFQARSSLQLLALLEEHVTSPGKELCAGLREAIWLEKEIAQGKLKKAEDLLAKVEEKGKRLLAKLEQEGELLRVARTRDQVDLLRLKGLNSTRGLFRRMQEVLAGSSMEIGSNLWETILRRYPPMEIGSNLWETILRRYPPLGVCIQKCSKIPAKDVVKQAAHCYTIYNVLSQHAQELAELQAVQGQIVFKRGPLSPEQVQTFICIGKAARLDIAEDPSTRPC